MASSPTPGDVQSSAALPEKGSGKTPIIIFFLLSLSIVVYCTVAISPIRVGDAHEYLLMVQAWSAHGSPDIRPADVESHIQLLQRNGLLREGQLEIGHYLRDTFTTEAGDIYFGHFWFYSLLAVPVWVLLRLTGGNEMAALQSINTIIFCLAAGLALFRGRQGRQDRLLLLALSAIGPVIWYIRWPHPEAFTWSMVLLAVVLLREDRFGGAAVAASLGAMQNPPLLLLALLAVILAAMGRQWRAAALASAGTALSFLPAFFYLALFGAPNLFVATGYTDFSLISPGRVWSVLTDLNQGMLPYVPLVLMIGLAGGGVALIRGRSRGILVLTVLLGMIILVGPQRNWNAGAAGMIRYAVWMVPLFAWLAVDHLPRGRLLVWVMGAGLLLQAGIVLGHGGRMDYLRQNSLARLVLTHCPVLYSPDPQIFADRQMGTEVTYWKGRLPIPFVTASGHVTKLLVDRHTHLHLQDYFLTEVAGDWLGEPNTERRSGLYYLHPPRHDLQVVDPEGMDSTVFRQQLKIRLLEVPEILSRLEFEIEVEVENRGPFGYWGQRACAPHPLKLGYRVYRGAESVKEGRAAMPFVLKPGKVTVRKMRITIPGSAGRYYVMVGTLLEKQVWSDSVEHLSIDCIRTGQDQFTGTVTRDTKKKTGRHPEEPHPVFSGRSRLNQVNP